MKTWLNLVTVLLTSLSSYTAVFAQISMVANLPTALNSQECQPLAQFESVFVFKHGSLGSPPSLWRFDAKHAKIEPWSKSGIRVGDVYLASDGVWWFEADLEGNNQVRFGTASSGEVRTRYTFQGFNNRFLGTTPQGLVIKAGNQILDLRNDGQIRTIGEWVELNAYQSFTWDDRIFWFDYEKATLFTYDGTQPRAQAVSQLGSFNAQFDLGKNLLIQTQDSWYRSDGTGVGTLAFFSPSPSSFYVTHTVIGDSLLLFSELKGEDIILWRTNGTRTGTFPVKTLSEDSRAGFPDYFVRQGDRWRFLHWTPQFERVIWETDGTAAQTRPLDTLPATIVRQIYWGVPLPSGAYVLMAETLGNGLEPAIFDGSWRDYTIRSGGGSSLVRADVPFTPIEWGNQVWLAAHDGQSGLELWRLDAQGEAVRVGDLASGGAWSFPRVLGGWNNELYWIAGALGSTAKVYRSPAQGRDVASTPAADLDWFQSMLPGISSGGSSYSAYMGGMARTKSGRIYVTGAAENWRGQSIVFSRGERPPSAPSSQGDHFLAQLDTAGRPVWIQQLAGYNPLSSNGQIHVAAAADEGVYWAGLAWGTGQIGGQNYTFAEATPLIARLSPDGKLVWAQTLQLGPQGSVEGLQSDADGNVYVVGTFARFNIVIGGLSVQASSSPAYFMAKLRPDGRAVWIQSFSADASWPAIGPMNDLQVDAAGKLYCLFGVGGQNYSAPCGIGKVPGGLLRLSAQGDIEQVRTWTGSDYWYPTALGIAPTGNVFVTGLLQENLDLGGGIEIRSAPRSTNCAGSGFLVKMDQNLNVLEARLLDEANVKVAQSLQFDSDGNYWLAGYREVPDFKPVPRYAHFPFSRGQQRVFVEAYSPRNELLAQRSFGVTETFLQGGNIELHLLPRQRVQLLGECRGMLDTLAAGSVEINDQSGYLIQFALPFQSIRETPDQELPDDRVQVVPNPAQHFCYIRSTDPDLTVTRIQLYDPLGRLLSTAVERSDFGVFRLNMNALPAGIYRVVIGLGEQQLVKTVVKTG